MENIRKGQANFADIEKKPCVGDDFLAKVLQKNTEDPENFTMSDVFLTCMNNIGAGSDTTSISLCAVLWYLLKYPDTYAAVRIAIHYHLAYKADISLS
jgi:cytochrome P450